MDNYQHVRGIGGSSDGKGKGITAPNSLGQQRAIERAWKNAGLSPATASLIEGHGTATQVGDVVEVSSLNTLFREFNRAMHALGSEEQGAKERVFVMTSALMDAARFDAKA